MTQRSAKQEGKERGYSAAIYAEVSDVDSREASCDCQEGEFCADCLSAAALQAEMNGRDYSPFEFIAHDINETGDRADGLWEAYDAGVALGVKHGVRERMRKIAA